jgi:hypothetical protein
MPLEQLVQPLPPRARRSQREALRCSRSGPHTFSKRVLFLILKCTSPPVWSLTTMLMASALASAILLRAGAQFEHQLSLARGHGGRGPPLPHAQPLRDNV